MRKYICTIINMFFFMLILFASMRLIFVVNYWQLIDIDGVPFTEVIRGFWKALPLDIATTCFILALPALLLFVGACINKNMSYRWIRWYFYIVIAVYILIVMGETGIYGEWRTKLSYKALAYLREPAEVFNTASTNQTIMLLLLWVTCTLMFCWWYVRWIEPSDGKVDLRKTGFWVYPVTFVMTFGLIFLGMRGGTNEIPISTSSGYFSKYKLVNVMTVNPAYNLMENTLNTKKVENNAHFAYMDFETSERITRQTHEIDCDSTISILKMQKPNIMVVLLESWSADLIESLGGDSTISPNFHALEKDGLLFTNFYASANRSQQAIASLYGGLPGLPVTTITNHPEKYYALPSLSTSLDSLGYFSSFYFGGELNYGNILSYLRYNDLDRIVECNDVDEYFHKGKLGIQDADMMPWVVDDINSQPQPFFTTLFTLSTHSPYDYPKIFDELQWPQIEKVYVNSAKYTDIALKIFIDKARLQPWYDSTLFVFVADHSHPSYKNHRMESFDYHKIPMLLYGKPLADSLKGKTFDKICGNTDLPATILAQLGLPHDQYFWSKDVFNTCYRPFAFFELYDGFGWKTNEGEYVMSGKWVLTNTVPEEMSDSIGTQGKAYMQYHFNLFNTY